MVVVVYTGQQQLRVLIRMMGTDVETLSIAVDTVHAVCCIISASSLGPSPASSRNCSGSGSCGSMEIWVRAVYAMAASINALLICLGLQPLIRIIHLHARTHEHARPQN